MRRIAVAALGGFLAGMLVMGHLQRGALNEAALQHASVLSARADDCWCRAAGLDRSAVERDDAAWTVACIAPNLLTP